MSLYAFRDAFQDMGRDHYSWEAYEKLYDFYDQLSEDTGEDFDLDVVAICCAWVEYEDVEELHKAYDLIVREEDEDDEDFGDRYVEALERRTTVFKLDNGGFLVEGF